MKVLQQIVDIALSLTVVAVCILAMAGAIYMSWMVYNIMRRGW